jgi:WD40 repeat protein
MVEIIAVHSDSEKSQAAGRLAVPGSSFSRISRWLAVAAALLLVGLVGGAVMLRVANSRGEVFVVETDDANLELTTLKNGEIVRIRDTKANQTWNIDTENYRIGLADAPEGLAIKLEAKGTLTLHRQGGKLTVTTGLPAAPVTPAVAPVHIPTAEELAQRANAADGLKHEDLPEITRIYIGGGDPKQAPPELVAVLGDAGFRCPGGAGPPAFSPDGKLLAVPSKEAVLLFDATSGRFMRSVAAPGMRSYGDWHVVLSQDNRTLAAGGDGQLELWDFVSGKLLHKLGIDNPPMMISHLAFSPDGKLVAGGCGVSKQVRVWDVRTGHPRFWWDGRKVGDPRPGMSQLAFSGDGRRLTAIGPSYDIHCWELLADGDFQEAKLGKDFQPTGARIALSPDGKTLAVFDAEKDEVRLCDARGTLRHTLSAPGCDLLAFASNGQTLLATQFRTSAYGVQRWDVATGKSLSEADLPGVERHGWGRQCEFSPDGRTLATIKKEYEDVVQLFDTTTGKPRLPDPGHGRGVQELAFSPDGKLLASAERAQAKLWDLATGKVLHTWEDSGKWVGPLAFSPDNRVLAMVTHQNQIELRDTGDGRLLRSMNGQEKSITVIAFSPDGKRLASGGLDPTIWIWRTADGKMERVLNQHAQTDALAFCPDGRFLISTTCNHDFLLMLWDLATGADKLGGKVEVEAGALAFLPDGKMLAGCRYDGQIWLRDRASGALKQTLAAPEPAKDTRDVALALGPAGGLAAISNHAGDLLLWQPGASTPRKRTFRLCPTASRRVNAVAFSPDGRYVAAANPDGTICLLRLAERGKVPELPVTARPSR